MDGAPPAARRLHAAPVAWAVRQLPPLRATDGQCQLGAHGAWAADPRGEPAPRRAAAAVRPVPGHRRAPRTGAPRPRVPRTAGPHARARDGLGGSGAGSHLAVPGDQPHRGAAHRLLPARHRRPRRAPAVGPRRPARGARRVLLHREPARRTQASRPADRGDAALPRHAPAAHRRHGSQHAPAARGRAVRQPDRAGRAGVAGRAGRALRQGRRGAVHPGGRGPRADHLRGDEVGQARAHRARLGWSHGVRPARRQRRRRQADGRRHRRRSDSPGGPGRRAAHRRRRPACRRLDQLVPAGRRAASANPDLGTGRPPPGPVDPGSS